MPNMLSYDDERALLVAWKERRDERAMHKLVLAHGPLASSMARKMARTGVAYEDLNAEAQLGLLEAARRFDLGNTTRFATYAAWWIRATLSAYVMVNQRCVRARMSVAGKRAFFRETRPMDLSLDTPIGEGDGATFGDMLEDEARSADDIVETADGIEHMRVALRTLNKRERAVLKARKLTDDPVTLETVGARFGVSKERIRQIETAALGKLRQQMEVAV